MNGRIPWLDIAENPSLYLSKRSQPDSDHKLEEPSYMKSDGIDAWLKHWLRLQRKNKCPLVLKDHSDRPSTPSKHKGKGKGKAQDIESDDSDDEQKLDTEDDSESIVDKAATATDNGPVLPPSPKSAALNRNTCCAFLTSLSDNTNYQQMLHLLRAAKVSINMQVLTVANPLARMATSWRELHRHGCPGHRQITTCPTRSMTPNRLHHCRPSSGGLERTQSQRITICSHGTNKWSWSSSASDWHSEASGLHNFQRAIPTYPLMLSTVHIHFRNMNNSVTKSKTLSLVMRKCTFYRYYLLSCNNHYYLYSLQEIEAAYPAQQLRQKKSTLEGTSKSVSGGNN